MLKKRFESLLALILISSILYIPSRLYAQETIFDLFTQDRPTQYFIKTEDDWTLSLHRYKPEKIKYGTSPVILCHGFNYNSAMWDLDEKHTLARYLQERGYDVWAVNLRGSGDSSKPAMSDFRSLSKFQIEKMPQIFMRMPFNVDKFDWTIDDHIHMDLPAIIEFIKAETKKRQVTWIGHSMGGLIMYAYLETEDQENIKNFIAIGSMINVAQPPDKMLALVASQKPVTNASLLINTTVAYQLRNLTLGTIRLPWEELFYNKENMDELTTIQMFRLTIDDTAPGVIAQFCDMINNGDFMSVDKEFNYTQNLYRIETPILSIMGAKDRMGSMETMRYAYNNISSEKKGFAVFSKANGYSADYGHCDLILGKRAEEEVYDYIYRWLSK